MPCHVGWVLITGWMDVSLVQHDFRARLSDGIIASYQQLGSRALALMYTDCCENRRP